MRRNLFNFFAKIFIALLVFNIMNCVEIYSQKKETAFYLGTVLGGPTPNQISENSSASFKAGINTAFTHTFFKHNQFSFDAEFGFEFISLGYVDKIKKDTTVNVDIHLQNGTVITTPINTYYKTDVNGDMKLNFFKVACFLNYDIKKFTLGIGPNLFFHSGGYDKGQVHVTVGEGGIEGLDQLDLQYNNSSSINRYSLMLAFRVERQVYKKLCLFLQVNRALTPFYERDLVINGYNDKFFLTTASFALKYTL
ncbi:MAG: hypothetical protein PHT69_04695 [Bacteroidales bacterium]|nr:hypothetical protein [Bacteroidales bacterium]